MFKQVSASGVFVIDNSVDTRVESLPAAFYKVEFSPEVGFYLVPTKPISLPAEIFGAATTTERAEKIMNTFNDRDGKNTGVLLSGIKGSGKTLLANDLCVRASKAGMPVLIIGNSFSGSGFTSFIKDIEQPAVVLFDEFDKVYSDTDDQNGLLTMFDGAGVVNKMFILTTNTNCVSEFLLNRPSRIRYHYEYNKLPRETMVDYLNAKLIHKHHYEKVLMLWDMVHDLNFDILQSLVEEINRYGDKVSFIDIIRDMNISITDIGRSYYHVVSASINGEQMPVTSTDGYRISVSNLMTGLERLSFDVEVPNKYFHLLPAFDVYTNNYNDSRFKKSVHKLAADQNRQVAQGVNARDYDAYTMSSFGLNKAMSVSEEDQSVFILQENLYDLENLPAVDCRLFVTYDRSTFMIRGDGIKYSQVLSTGDEVEVIMAKRPEPDLLDTLFA